MYLQERKLKLQRSKAIMLINLAENCSFTIQDMPQSYHWDNTQVTLNQYTGEDYDF